MPRVNYCSNKGCHKSFYDNFKKPFCPECQAEFLNKAISHMNKPKNTGNLKGKTIVPVPPSPNDYDPLHSKTWIVKG
jgi:hypothetical protein